MTRKKTTGFCSRSRMVIRRCTWRWQLTGLRQSRPYWRLGHLRLCTTRSTSPPSSLQQPLASTCTPTHTSICTLSIEALALAIRSVDGVKVVFWDQLSCCTFSLMGSYQASISVSCCICSRLGVWNSTRVILHIKQMYARTFACKAAELANGSGLWMWIVLLYVLCYIFLYIGVWSSS